jgi:hypothetical protein
VDISIKVITTCIHGNMPVFTSYKQKCLFFKNEEQEGKTNPVWGIGTSGSGEDIGKG